MPIAGLIQGFVEVCLDQGIDAPKAEEIYRYTLSEVENASKQARGMRMARAKEQLVRVSELYGQYFDAAAIRKWQTLTGISVGPGEVAYPDSFLPTQTITNLRRTLTGQVNRVRDSYRAKRSDGKVEVTTSKLDLKELVGRRARTPQRANLSRKEATHLKPPRSLIHQTLQNPDSRVVVQQFGRFEEFARSHGSQATSLAGRDMEKAPADLTAILAEIWKITGCRRLSLIEIRTHLAAALESFFFKTKKYADRLNGNYLDNRYSTLYAQIATAALDVFVTDYHCEVVLEGKSHTLFFEKHELALWKHKSRFLPHLDNLLPPPTIEQIENLHAMAIDGDLDAIDFYAAAGIDKYDLFKLCVAMPERFELQLSEGNALTPLGNNRNKAEQLSKEAIAAKWNDMVVDGGMAVDRFCQQLGVRYNRVKRLRRSTDLFKEPRPQTHVPPDSEREGQLAYDTIAAMEKVFARDVLQTVPEVLAELNGDQTFVSKWGEIDTDRYWSIRTAADIELPNFGAREVWAPTLKEEYLQLIDQQPQITNKEAVKALEALHPHMTRGRLRQLFAVYPNLPKPWLGKRRTGPEARKLAKTIATMLAGEPQTVGEISACLAAQGVDCSPSAISSLLSRYRDDFFSEVRPVNEAQKYRTERMSHIGRSLLQLAIRCAPPTADRQQIATVWAKLLGRAGLSGEVPQDAIVHQSEYTNAPGEVSWDTHRAITFSEIVAAYAHGSPITATAQDIRLAVLHDYPIDPKRLSQLEKRWERSPGDFPALTEFFGKNGKLRVHGTAKKPTSIGEVARSRFIGGWQPQRDLLPVDQQALHELAVLSQALRVALLQPELETMFDDMVGGQPLAHDNLLWVSHALGDNLPVARILRRAGATGSKTIIVATPYGSSPLVTRALDELGHQLRLAPLDEAGYPAAVEKALDDAIELHKKNGDPIKVMDDGGLVSKLIATKPAKYAKYAPMIRVVELTTQGIMLAEKDQLQHLVVSVARSAIKKMTDRASGQSVAGKIVQKILRAGDQPAGKNVVIHGYGNMGVWIAEYLAAANMRVTIVDTNETQVELARAAGYDAVLAEKDHSINVAEENALRAADHVVGITGDLSMDLPRFRLLKRKARWASAASKRSEGDMAALAAASTSRKVLPEDNPLIQSRTAAYELDGKTIYVDGDGWPINFDGGIEISNATIIQFMHMGMLLGLLVQASKSGRRKGYEKLLPHLDEYAVKKIEPYLEKLNTQVYDPDRWAEDLEWVTALFAEMGPANSGSGPSQLDVQRAIGEIMAGEDPDAPFTDEDLRRLLGKRGITIARRTVATVRGELGIPSSWARGSRA